MGFFMPFSFSPSPNTQSKIDFLTKYLWEEIKAISASDAKGLMLHLLHRLRQLPLGLRI